MADSQKVWTTQELLHEFLWIIVKDIHEMASQYIDVIREAAADDNPNRLKDRLVELRGGAVNRIFTLIDGSSGPSSWPGIKLVNAATGEALSEELEWDLAEVESEYLDTIDPPTEAD